MNVKLHKNKKMIYEILFQKKGKIVIKITESQI